MREGLAEDVRELCNSLSDDKKLAAYIFVLSLYERDDLDLPQLSQGENIGDY